MKAKGKILFSIRKQFFRTGKQFGIGNNFREQESRFWICPNHFYTF